MFWNAGILPAKYADRDVRVPSNKAGSMRKILLVLLFTVSVLYINATIREVSLDGSHEYTSIPWAIYESVDGDTVLIHPGRYLQHIDIIDKEITLISNFFYSGNRDDIYNTIIDANYENNCIRVENNAIAKVNGFSFTNGIGYSYSTSTSYGGAITVNNSSEMELNNSIISNNSADYTGGVNCNNSSILRLSGNVITNNSSVNDAGGLSATGEATLYFDSINLNNIYDNYGKIQDIYMYNSTSNSITLDTLSVNLTEPDGFFVSFEHYSEPAPLVSCINPYMTRVNSDIYVSPDGDDSNDGLTSDTALQTIAYATRLIEPNEQNSNTVFVLPGTYSKELNNQFFPVAVQSHTKLLGAGDVPFDVIIGDELSNNSISVFYAENVEVGNFQMRRHNMHDAWAFKVHESESIIVRDIDFGESVNNRAGLSIFYSNRIDILNCCFHNFFGASRFRSLVSYRSSVLLNNILIYDNESTATNGRVSCIDLGDSAITANNIVVTNNQQAYPGTLFQYGNTGSNSPGGNIELSNFLMYNNISTSSSLPMMIILNDYEQCYLNNMTIANNSGPTGVLRLGGDYTVRNSILYNPSAGAELNIWEPSPGDSNPLYSYVDADYNLIRGGLDDVNGTEEPNNTLVWGNHNIDTDPLFRGDVHGDVELEDIRWVQLTQGSPCVNAGTPDTLGMNLPTVDIAGNPRVWDNIIDMGAYEYNSTPNSDETAPTPPETIQVSHFPNPITPNGANGKVAFIEFTLPKKPIEKPSLEIFNIRGQKIRDLKITQSFSELVRSAGLSSEDKQSGEYYSQVWDCKDNNRKSVASGIYFYKVSSGGDSAIGKMMLLK